MANADAVHRRDVNRKFAHGMRGESAARCIGEIEHGGDVFGMNLNKNERIEFYEISEGSPISGYLRQIVDYHFALPAEDSYSAFKDFQLAGDTAPQPVARAASRIGAWQNA